MTDKRTRTIKNPPLPRPAIKPDKELMEKCLLTEEELDDAICNPPISILNEFLSPKEAATHIEKTVLAKAFPIIKKELEKKHHPSIKLQRLQNKLAGKAGFDEGIKKATDASTFTKQLEEMKKELESKAMYFQGNISGSGDLYIKRDDWQAFWERWLQ